MNKLLLLALLGLILGGGIWKAQNPDGTLDDLKAHSISSFDRLKSGVDAGVGTIANYPQTTEVENSLDERLAILEEQLEAVRNNDLESDDIVEQQGAIEENLANLTEQHDDLADLVDDLASADSQTNTSDPDNNTQVSAGETDPVSETDLAALSERIDSRLSDIESRLDSNNSANTDAQLIESLSEKLSTAETRLTELEERTALASQPQESPGTPPVSPDAEGGESLSIAYTQAQIREELARVQDQLDSPEQLTDTTDLAGLLDANRSRLDALDPMIRELPASSARAAYASQNQSQLQTQVDELREQVAALSTPVTNPLDLLSQDSSNAVEYKIYFNRNSAEITLDAAAVLDSFIVQEQNRTTGVSIFGFTDRRGAPEYNQQLALNRASNVRAYLIDNGFDIELIKAINSFGEDTVVDVSPDETADAEQRVVVLLAEQP